MCVWCSFWYRYLCQDRDVLLQRNQSISSDDSMSSQFHTQRVVQCWLQVCHVHPGPGHTITCKHHVNKLWMSPETESCAACVLHTCWRVSRAPLCCWWGGLCWPTEASLTAPPLAASGGRKSRKYEPQCCWGREGQVRRTLRSLITKVCGHLSALTFMY